MQDGLIESQRISEAYLLRPCATPMVEDSWKSSPCLQMVTPISKLSVKIETEGRI